MRILVACEESQVVCKAFRALGHEAYSCDTLPCSGGHPEWHIQSDVLEQIDKGWDMMIAHPPCTYFAKAGMHYLKTQPGRWDKHAEMFALWNALWNAPVKYIAMENPVGWLNTNWKKPDQIIHPWYFGENANKETCLWLKGLPKLIPTDMLPRPVPSHFIIRKSGKRKGQKYYMHWREGKSAKDRSKTFQGIADAMAEQWGNLVTLTIRTK